MRHCVALRYQAPALHMNFGGKISYKDPSRTLKNLFFDHALKISDILRPLVINTEEFGQMWSAASFEKKQRLSSFVKSCEEVAKKVQEDLRLHLVETLGKISFLQTRHLVLIVKRITSTLKAREILNLFSDKDTRKER